MQTINKPEVVAEVRAAADEYERALSENDLAAMDELFWNSPLTVRYGPNGSNYGHESISSYRKGRPKGTRKRNIVKKVVTTFGDDFPAVQNKKMITQSTNFVDVVTDIDDGYRRFRVQLVEVGQHFAATPLIQSRQGLVH